MPSTASDLKMAEYYARRAPEYERIYAKPERQSDLARLREFIHKTLAGKNVLEIACGTGYWTEVIAQTASSVTASDINDEVLHIARTKPGTAAVRFMNADGFNLPDVGSFSGAFAAFWWSHIPKARLNSFLAQLHENLSRGATVVFIDNRYVEGNSTPISRTDAEGNTFQLRLLQDGSRYEVLKNFPTREELRSAVQPFATEIAVSELEYYWALTYRAM